MSKYSKVIVKVFITKGGKFRAKISEPDQFAAYEVTVGGQNWKDGMGQPYKRIIRHKIGMLMERLKEEMKNQ